MTRKELFGWVGGFVAGATLLGLVGLMDGQATQDESDNFRHCFSAIADESTAPKGSGGGDWRVEVEIGAGGGGGFGTGSCTHEYTYRGAGSTFKDTFVPELIAFTAPVNVLFNAGLGHYRLTCSGGVLDIDYCIVVAGAQSGQAPPDGVW